MSIEDLNVLVTANFNAKNSIYAKLNLCITFFIGVQIITGIGDDWAITVLISLSRHYCSPGNDVSF